MTESSKKYCQNCGTALYGEYCSSCGQRDRHIVVPVKDLASEFIVLLPTFDERLFRTLALILFRPGAVMLEYLAGKRKKYISPFKLYFTVSALFFFISAVRNVDYESVRKDNIFFRDSLAASVETDSAGLRVRDADSGIGFSIEDTAQAQDIFGSGFMGGIRLVQKNPQLLFNTIKEHRPKIFFLLLPIFALLLKILYVRSGVLYIQHLILAFYFHSFVFMIFLVADLLKMTGVDIVQSASNVLYLFVPLNLYAGMKTVYGQSHATTVLKFLMVAFSYLFIFFVIISIVALIVIIFLYL